MICFNFRVKVNVKRHQNDSQFTNKYLFYDT